MKIAVVGSIWHRTPPKTYGGTEDMVANLVRGLLDRKHKVTLFASGDSKTNATLVPIGKKAIRDLGRAWHDEENIHAHMRKFIAVFQNAQAYDVIHIHMDRSQDYIALPFAEASQTPVILTMHFNPMLKKKERLDRHAVLMHYKSLPFVSISNAQRGDLRLNFIKTVYNGLALETFPFSEKKGAYAAWLGRVKPEKGTKEAIIAAKKAGVVLKLMGSVDMSVPYMREYFEKEVLPLCDGKQIQWLGEANFKQKIQLLKHAAVLLNPIQWEEPFGLVMAEAQAVGTPVISFKRGAAAEVIMHKKTGFLVNSVSEMAHVIHNVSNLSRAACRSHINDRFTLPHMINGYEQAYKIAISEWESYRKG